MEEEFKISDYKPAINFKDLLLKVVRNWWLFVVFIAISVLTAYQVNLRKKDKFRVKSQFVVSNDKNPFFTSNTNLTFNWGGASNKIQTHITLFKSRTHNEKVVEYLQYYVDYKKQAKYWAFDAYKKTPFLVEVDTSAYQLLNTAIQIKPIDESSYQLSYKTDAPRKQVQHYGSKDIKVVTVKTGEFKRNCKFDSIVELPFLRFTLKKNKESQSLNYKPFTISFKNFDAVVKSYLGISVSSIAAGSPIINIALKGSNKHRLVDYLNASVEVLSRDQLARKNLFATKTIEFVDKMLDSLRNSVLNSEDELNSFYRGAKSMNLSNEASKLSEKLTKLDIEKNALDKKYDYLNVLEKYLVNKKEYTDVPAPSIVGIEETNIVANVNKIIGLSVDRSKFGYAVREDSPIFAEIDRDINSLKAVLFENISSYRSVLDLEKRSVNKDLYAAEGDFSNLPEDQQKLGNIQRQYNLSNNLYQLFLGKKSEAKMIKAASVSDLLVIDKAKVVSALTVGPNKDINYIIALILGIAIPTMIIVILFLLNTNITGPKDVEFLSNIPILGVVGKSKKFYDFNGF